jgi:hypothetical protein
MEISFWVLLWVIRYLNILVYREKAEGRKGEKEKSAATHVHTASYELTYPGLLQTGLSVIAWHYLHRLPSFSFSFSHVLAPVKVSSVGKRSYRSMPTYVLRS